MMSHRTGEHLLRRPWLWLALGAALGTADPVTAQAVRYGDLEDMFGEPVTMSATGKPQRATDVPVAMEIVTADEIRRSGATNIPDILRQFAGVDVQSWSPTAADVGVRGYNQPYSPRLLVLLNGRQLYLDHYATTAWATIPVELAEIRQIEVVKGPNAALFGFNAVSGVINIITTNPLYEKVNNVTARLGTQTHRDLSVVTTVKPAETVGVRLSAGGLRSDDFDTPLPAAEKRLRRDSERTSFAGDLRAQIFDKVQFGLEMNHTEVRQTEMLPFYVVTGTSYRTNSVKAQILAESDFGLTDITFYSNWLNAGLRSPISTFPSINYAQTVNVAKLDHLLKLNANHTLRGSLEWRHNRANTSPVTGGTVEYDVYAAGAMWDWQITQDLAFTNAARLDLLQLSRGGSIPAGQGQPRGQWDRDIVEPSFNSALVWKPTQVDTLRLAYGRGAQVPSLVEFGAANAVNTVPPFGLVGNPRLDPTVVSNYEIGYDRQIEPIRGLLRTSLFYQRSTDIKGFPSGTTPILPPVSSYPVFTFQNIGNSSMVGWEIGLRNQRGTSWRWGLDYALLAVDDQFWTNRTGVNPTNPVDFQKSTPRHNLTGRIGWGNDQFEADLYARYASSVDMLRSTGVTGGYRFDRVNDFITLWGRIAWTPVPGLTAALSGTTLNQAVQRESSGPAVERRIFLTLSANL